MRFAGSLTGTGTVTLKSDMTEGDVTKIRIPDSLFAVIKNVVISGDTATFLIRYSNDITAETPTYVVDIRLDLASSGILELEKDIVLRGKNDKAGLVIEKSVGTGTTAITFDLELEVKRRERRRD